LGELGELFAGKDEKKVFCSVLEAILGVVIHKDW
jgi:hypothetical protein